MFFRGGVDTPVYTLKLHLYTRFLAACASAIAQRNHLFCLKHQNESSILTAMLRQASDHCKNIKSAKLDLVIYKGVYDLLETCLSRVTKVNKSKSVTLFNDPEL